MSLSVTISNDPRYLGNDATLEDVRRYAEQLGKELTEEFGETVSVSLGNVESAGSRASTPELQKRVTDIDFYGEWYDILQRSQS